MRTSPFRPAHVRTPSRAAAAAAAGLCAALVLPTAGAALASPAQHGSAGSPASRIPTVERDLHALTLRIGAEVEKYDTARIALATAQRRATAADAQAKRTRQVYLAKRAALSRFAVSAYQTGPNGQIVAVVSSSPGEYLDKMSTLGVVAKRGTEIVSAVDAARLRYARDLVGARDAAQAALRVTQSLAASKAAIEGQIAHQRQILAGLRAEQARLQELAARQKAARDAAAARTAAAARQISRVTESATGGTASARRAATTRPAVSTAASRSSTRTVVRQRSTSASTPAPAPVAVPASGRGARAVAAAFSVLGRPYVWGASGPSSFDCSGLTMWSWARAGVSIPHSSSAQYSSGAHVSKSALQPGDLLFFYSPISHVGMYIGGGRMVHAPHTGDVVRIATPQWSEYVGAVRPG